VGEALLNISAREVGPNLLAVALRWSRRGELLCQYFITIKYMDSNQSTHFLREDYIGCATNIVHSCDNFCNRLLLQQHHSIYKCATFLFKYCWFHWIIFGILYKSIFTSVMWYIRVGSICSLYVCSAAPIISWRTSCPLSDSSTIRFSSNMSWQRYFTAIFILS